jgi:SAM-dependent methyltransferase
MAGWRGPSPQKPGASPTRDFNAAYEGRPPWDLGRPQQEVLRLAEEGEFIGGVLDIGCGTGENALELARRGMTVWGVDSAPNAIRRARAKAGERGLQVEFRIGDALHLGRLGRSFDSILDCGLLHVFDDPERMQYVAELGRALRPGGRYFFLVFSDAEPDWGGPRRLSEGDIRSAFQEAWHIDFLRRAHFERNDSETPAQAWCGRVSRNAA